MYYWCTGKILLAVNIKKGVHKELSRVVMVNLYIWFWYTIETIMTIIPLPHSSQVTVKKFKSYCQRCCERKTNRFVQCIYVVRIFEYLLNILNRSVEWLNATLLWLIWQNEFSLWGRGGMGWMMLNEYLSISLHHSYCVSMTGRGRDS